MDFLNKIKTQNAQPTEKPANPFAKPNPFAKKTEPTTTVEAPKEEGKKKLTLGFPKKDAVKKEDEPVKEVATVEAVEKKELKKSVPLAPKKLAIKEEETEVKVEEVKAEEAKVEEVKAEEVKVEEVKVETVEEVKTETVEEVKADTSKKGKKGKSKKAAEPKKKEEQESDDTVELTTTRMSYADVVEAIKSPFVEEEWETFRAEIHEALDEIEISDDINPSTLKTVLAELSRLRQMIWLPLQDTKTLYDQLSQKEPEGLIERIKRTAFTEEDRNDMERKKAGIEACMNYEDNRGNLINLYEVLDETRSRYNFLKATMDSIQYKSNILITMNGALKLEKDHMGAEV